MTNSTPTHPFEAIESLINTNDVRQVMEVSRVIICERDLYSSAEITAIHNMIADRIEELLKDQEKADC